MKVFNKKIGIIGGADPAASCLLYQRIIDLCLSQGLCKNGSDFPEIILINYPFTRGMSQIDAHKYKELLCRELQACYDTLTQACVEIIAIACNTLHCFIPDINTHEIQQVHIIKSVLQKAEQLNAKHLFILATETTLCQGLYKSPEIHIQIPTHHEQKLINTIIERIHTGDLRIQDINTLSDIICTHYTEEPFDAVVFGCTDLPVLHNHYPIDMYCLGNRITVLDSITILAEQLINQARIL